MGIHERTVSMVLLYMSFCSHNIPVKRLVFVSFKDKEKSFVGRCKSTISKHWRIGSYSSPQHAPTCGIIHTGKSKLSTNVAIKTCCFCLEMFPTPFVLSYALLLRCQGTLQEFRHKHFLLSGPKYDRRGWYFVKPPSLGCSSLCRWDAA